MKERKSTTPKTAHKNLSYTQNDMVLDYLVAKGRKGATNFEMMVTLHICDVRKCISDLRLEALDYEIESRYETGDSGKTYKRYWAYPADFKGTFVEWLTNERKYSGKTSTKRTGGGRR